MVRKKSCHQERFKLFFLQNWINPPWLIFFTQAQIILLLPIYYAKKETLCPFTEFRATCKMSCCLRGRRWLWSTCPVWVGQIAIGKNKSLKKKWELLGIFFCSGTEAIKLWTRSQHSFMNPTQGWNFKCTSETEYTSPNFWYGTIKCSLWNLI